MNTIIDKTTTLKERYRRQFRDRAFVKTFVWSIVMVLISLVVNYFAALYAAERASSSVTDIILSNIPAFDVDWLFTWGPPVFWTIMLVIVFYDPKRVPFFLKCVALFVVIRSGFISLTHIGPFPDQISTAVDFGPSWFRNIAANTNFFIFSSGADLFFSGHTGLPFLMGLIFWTHRNVRTFCIAGAIFFAIVVLLGHLHYSIDVASAFFISYAIYHIALQLFKADEQRFLS